MIASEIEHLARSSQPAHQQLFTKVVSQLAEEVLALSAKEQKPGIYTKKVLKRYINVFVFEIGCEIPNDHSINLLYSYLEDPLQQCIPKLKFEKFVRQCLLLYADSKSMDMGGIFQRLLLQTRTQMLGEQQNHL